MKHQRSLFMANFLDSTVSRSATIKECLAAVSKSGALLATIVDSRGILVGVFHDSDARRALLEGASLLDAVTPYIISDPVVANYQASSDELRILAHTEGVREIPLIDEQGILRDIFVIVSNEFRRSTDPLNESRQSKEPVSNPMVLLAGGKGTRLRSVVSDRPKPLAIVGGKPILQTIIENAVSCGFRKFLVSVNYKADLIVEHLKSTLYHGLDIQCLHEKEFLGTAGSLGMLSDNWNEPILVSNADILTNIPYDRVLNSHEKSGASATCVVRPYQIQVPFGVVEMDMNHIMNIVEKPIYQHFVNSGIYALSPSVKTFVQNNKYLDMPELLKSIIDNNQKVVPFLMHEYWRDVGRPEEYYAANEEYESIFGSSY